MLPDPGNGLQIGIDVSEPAPGQTTVETLVYALRCAWVACRLNDPVLGSTVYESWQNRLSALPTAIQPRLAGYLDLSQFDPATWPAALAPWLAMTPTFPWLDLETGVPTETQIQAAVDTVKQRYGDAGIYTGERYWLSIRNPQVGGSCKVWTANYATPAVFNIWYGGWTRASIVQYAGNVEILPGVMVDLNALEGSV